MVVVNLDVILVPLDEIKRRILSWEITTKKELDEFISASDHEFIAITLNDDVELFTLDHEVPLKSVALKQAIRRYEYALVARLGA